VTESFTSLVRAYLGQLLLLTRRIYQCSPLRLIAGVPVVLVNQVSLILALMLPLKVIIMLGSDGVPRYFRFFMTEETRNAWMLFFAASAIGFFLLYALTEFLLGSLSKSGGQQVLDQSRKAGLFDDQERFAADVFLKVLSSWGTMGMVAGGMALGLLLEWRLVALLAGVIFLEFVLFVIYWNRFREPERADQRERLVAMRMALVQNLSTVNVLIFFGGLVFLFLTDPTMNFIVGIVMFILTRQILARAVKMLGDANFFRQHQERIDALVHPGRHLREKRSAVSDSFEQLLMPQRRGRFFEAVANSSGAAVGGLDWAWRDIPGTGSAMFVAPGGQDRTSEYRLKVKMREGDAGLARETMFYQSESAARLGLSCSLVHSGSVFGRGYLLLESPELSPCPGKDLRDIVHAIRMRLWQHRPDKELAARLLRSFPSIDARLTSERVGRIRVACNSGEHEAALDALLGNVPTVISTLNSLPRVLINRSLARTNIMLTSAGEPVILNWDAIRFDVIGSDLVLKDLNAEYAPEKVAEELSGSNSKIANLPQWALPLVVQMNHIDRLIAQEAYGAALEQVPEILGLLNQYELARPCSRGASPLHSDAVSVADMRTSRQADGQ